MCVRIAYSGALIFSQSGLFRWGSVEISILFSNEKGFAMGNGAIIGQRKWMLIKMSMNFISIVYVELQMWHLKLGQSLAFSIELVENACELNFWRCCYSMRCVVGVCNSVISIQWIHSVGIVFVTLLAIVFRPDDWNHRIWLIFNLILLNIHLHYTVTHIPFIHSSSEWAAEIFGLNKKCVQNHAFHVQCELTACIECLNGGWIGFDAACVTLFTCAQFR